MTAFLSWLYAQIANVKAWFSDRFWYYIYVAQNAYQWLTDKANAAYNNAVTWASGQITSVKLLITAVYTWAIPKIDAARLYAFNLVAPVWGWITLFYNNAVNFTIGQVNELRSWWISQKSLLEGNLHTWVNAQIANIKQFDTSPYFWILSLRFELYNLLDALKPTILVGIVDLVKTELANIKLFFSDPVGFILSLLWNVFVTYLCNSLAYALGTVTETLPPIPAWGHAGGPITIPDYPPPGTVPSGLYRPIYSLYVSGYIFGPTHKGTDFGIVDAQPIFAAHPGTIGEAGWSTVGYGFTVTIAGSPWWTRYGHLKQVLVYPGQQVNGGDVIAYGNSTGNSTGSHLHFEIKRDGVFIDPLSVYGLGG